MIFFERSNQKINLVALKSYFTWKNKVYSVKKPLKNNSKAEVLMECVLTDYEYVFNII